MKINMDVELSIMITEKNYPLPIQLYFYQCEKLMDHIWGRGLFCSLHMFIVIINHTI